MPEHGVDTRRNAAPPQGQDRASEHRFGLPRPDSIQREGDVFEGAASQQLTGELAGVASDSRALTQGRRQVEGDARRHFVFLLTVYTMAPPAIRLR